MRVSRVFALSILAACLAPYAPAQTAQPQDEEFARLVKEWTTRAEFLSPLVDHLPQAAGVPTPKDVLGYYPGAPKKLTHVGDLNRYYRALAAASPRVKIIPAGLTDEGRECLVIAVSDEDNIRNLDAYKGHLARLAVEESPLYDQIRKNVIVMMSAAAEPDGRDRYAEWYYKYKLCLLYTSDAADE